MARRPFNLLPRDLGRALFSVEAHVLTNPLAPHSILGAPGTEGPAPLTSLFQGTMAL